MKFRRTIKVDEEGIPITNLVDVLFLLIVFFMLSTVMSFDRGLRAKLPETSGTTNVSNRGINVLVDRAGRVFLEGVEVPLGRLGSEVKVRLKTQGQNVILKSDRDTRYQAIADVMDRLLDVGVTDVSLPVVQREGSR